MVDIKVDIDVKQVKRMMRKLNGLMPSLVVKPLSAAAQMIAGIAIKDYTRGPRPERLGRRTGRLAQSIYSHVKIKGRDAEGIIGATAKSKGGFDYPAYWEFKGRPPTGPRPFLVPSRDDPKNKSKWLAMFNKVFLEQFNKMMGEFHA